MNREIASQLGISVGQVKKTRGLLDEGNTVPFIARYRKEATGKLDEVQIRDVAKLAEQIEQREQRRQTILESIDDQGELTAELRREIEGADSLSRLEDLYAPYRPRRLTRGRKAREAGLDEVAQRIRESKAPETVADDHRCEDFPTREDVLQGARDILAEEMADDAQIRRYIRRKMRKKGRFVCKKRRGAEGDKKYEMYTGFERPLKALKPHQVLAIRRGEKEKELSAGIDVDEQGLVDWIVGQVVESHGSPRRHHRMAIEDGFKRLLHPSLERDLRRELEEEADAHAIGVFSLNLKALLLQPPMPNRVVVGIDPGMRTGCKIAVIGETGELLRTDQIWVHDRRKEEAPKKVADVVERYEADLVAIGNGTGSRETEEVVAKALREKEGVQYAIIDEAGASVYSASDIAREEFPELDVSFRGAVSIGRRLQDPLAELVKIDPKSIGVGMYQHDVNQVELRRALEAVIEDVVNAVGVDLNSASKALLSEVAGVGPALARRIVAHRDEQGPFEARRALKDVRGVGAKTFEQCAGFLRIRDGSEALDNTGIHPENYQVAKAILKDVGAQLGDDDLPSALERWDRSGRREALQDKYGVGAPTMSDILEALAAPGRDPRDELDPPELRSDVLTMKDLKEGMRLEGTIRNVVDFGAFVDIGVKEDGLVHISEMANRYIKNPHDVVSVGDRVEVKILSVDRDRGRIGLSMKALS